jgi:hypothetical protein
MGSSFESEIEQFIDRIDSMRITLTIIQNTISEYSSKAQECFDNFMNNAVRLLG